MAELIGGAFLSSFFQVTLERLATSNFIDYFFRGKLERLVEKLQCTLNSINPVLDDAEEKQYQSQDVKKWLGDVKHAMYEADQLLDEIATDAPLKKLKVESQPATSNNLFGFFPAFTNPFESRIKELLKNLDSLAEQKDSLALKQGACASNEGGVSWKSSKRLPTTSLVDESGIYGRETGKEETINFLLADSDSGIQVPIISIMGLGGMGKTTLAQLVYNDHRIKGQFEIKAWVYVSESFDVVGLTKAILRSFHSSVEGEDLNLLQHQLQQRLTGKKYLLVLDDVWNGNMECWELLLLPFNHGSSGSKIIVTTRNKEVASVMHSTKLLQLKQLEESDCWSLFVRCAFHGTNVSEYPNLESIGKKIVEKCGGLPLAVKTLGNLLQRKFSQSEWVKILETDMWRLSDGGDNININPVLRLSYHNLPSNLKRCFAYCSIFCRGYKFGKGELIKLWMAEGLLKCYETDKSEEELGNEFFDDLELISFFQQSVNPCDGKYYFIMHDLVNDLAKSVSGEFCLWIEGDRVQDIPKRARHIWCSLDLKDGDRKLEHIYKIEGLRSLMVGACDLKICNNVQHGLFSRLKHLRMLSFRYCDLSEVAVEISNLKLLRYLDLSCTGITSLPNSICMLYNLQTLLLQNCFKLIELPSDFYELVNLRHLNLKGTRIKKMPRQIGRLHHLQTLTDLVVGEQSGSDIKELAKLNHLQGKLHIPGLENVINPADAATANLKDKKYLEELRMIYGANGEMDDSIIERDVCVLDALQPNNNLNRLTIEGYRGTRFPNWLGGCHLPNLVSLNLRECKFCTRLPPLGQLPSLKMLSIWRCRGIEIIGPEFYGNNSSNVPFRSLEILQFQDMSDWKEWFCLEGFPSLKEFSITFCPKLKIALPQHLSSLQKLVISYCQELEASIPKADNISRLELKGCENIVMNEFPSSLKMAVLGGTQVIESSLEQILFNNAFLEKLDLCGFFGGNLEWSSLDLCSYNSLRTLSITDWHSSSLPFALHLFTNLHSLELYNCPELESFPGLGLPSLKQLCIRHCPKLKRALLQHLPSLQKLVISDCQELEVSISKSDNICRLELKGCENILLNELPSSLKSVVLGGTQVIESSLEQILSSSSFLEELDVEDFNGPNLELPSLDLRSCNSLCTLSITDWHSSSFPFPLHLFINLHSLLLSDCPKLGSFPEGGLPSSLSRLEIFNCPKLIASREEWGLFKLNSLKEFSVSDDFENVESFPEESLLPPTINFLKLKWCSKLRILNYKGLVHLKSLKSLHIDGCPCLESLPEEGLPNSLSTLDISGCSLLKQHYQKEEGELSHTISHIPSVG